MKVADLNVVLVARDALLSRCGDLEAFLSTAEQNASVMGTRADHLEGTIKRLETETVAAREAQLKVEKDAKAKHFRDEEMWLSERNALAADLSAKVERISEMDAQKQTADATLAALQAELQKMSVFAADTSERNSSEAAAWSAREAELEDSVAAKAIECAELRATMLGVREAESTLLNQRQAIAQNLDQTRAANGELEARCTNLQKALDATEASTAEAQSMASASAAELRRVEDALTRLGAEKVERHTQQADADAVTNRVLDRASDAEARCAELEAALIQAELSTQQATGALHNKLAAEARRVAKLSDRLEVSAADSLMWRSRFENEVALREGLQVGVKEHQDAEKALMRQTHAVSDEAHARLAEMEAVVRSTTEQLVVAEQAALDAQRTAGLRQAGLAVQEHHGKVSMASVEAEVDARVEEMEAAFQQKLKTAEDQATQKLRAATQARAVLEEQVDELSRQLDGTGKDEQDWLDLERDLTAQMKETDKENRKRKKAEARLNEAWEELSDLHESIEANSRTSFSSTHLSANMPSQPPPLEDCLREQIASLKTKVELVGAVHAQLLVDGHRCDIRIERSSDIDEEDVHASNDSSVGRDLPPRSAIEMWAESTGTELRSAFGDGGGDPSDDISPIPRGDPSSVDEHTRALLVSTREELAELTRAKEEAEKELRREVRRRRQAEAAANDWDNTSVSVVDHETAVSMAVEAAVAASEDKAQEWILRIQNARKAERKAIEDEREEALAQRAALQAELSVYKNNGSSDEVSMPVRSPSAGVSGVLSSFVD